MRIAPYSSRSFETVPATDSACRGALALNRVRLVAGAVGTLLLAAGCGLIIVATLWRAGTVARVDDSAVVQTPMHMLLIGVGLCTAGASGCWWGLPPK
jgi:hypothetical protein